MKRLLSILTVIIFCHILFTGVIFGQGYITLSSNGWSDPDIGLWDPDTKTGTLTQDVKDETKEIIIEIISDNITLDGNGKTITGGLYWDIGVYIYNRTGVTVKNLNVTNFGYGIVLYNSNGNNLSDNTLKNNLSGIYLQGSSSNNLSDNTVDLSSVGISLWSNSDNNTIKDNTCTNNHPLGIYLNRSRYNNLTGNIISNNTHGLKIYLYSNNNTITGNTISNNYYGIQLATSSNNNKMYNNNFIDNESYHAYNYSCSGNIFNLPEPTGGNYWSGWTSPDSDGDGFVDDPYLFYGGLDNLPWTVMNGWLIPAPDKAIENLIADVENLSLNEGNTNALTSKLYNAISSLEKENNNAAINKLNAFINQVNAFIPEKISTEDGQALIEAANSIINQISGSLAKRGTIDKTAAQPREYAIEQNYPNPFNPETEIHYQLPKSSNITLKVYNLMGQEIKTLVNNYHTAGYHSVKWDGTNNHGMKVASGIYIYIMRAGSFVDVKKLIFIQ